MEHIILVYREEKTVPLIYKSSGKRHMTPKKMKLIIITNRFYFSASRIASGERKVNEMEVKSTVVSSRDFAGAGPKL